MRWQLDLFLVFRFSVSTLARSEQFRTPFYAFHFRFCLALFLFISRISLNLSFCDCFCIFCGRSLSLHLRCLRSARVARATLRASRSKFFHADTHPPVIRNDHVCCECCPISRGVAHELELLHGIERATRHQAAVAVVIVLRPFSRLCLCLIFPSVVHSSLLQYFLRAWSRALARPFWLE